MDIGFDQSEAQISLCSKFALHNKTNMKCPSSFTKRKALGMRVSKFSDPLGTVNTCFLLRTFFVTNIEYLDILSISSVYKI